MDQKLLSTDAKEIYGLNLLPVMEFDSHKDMHDKNIGNSKRGAPEDDQEDFSITENPKEQPKVHEFRKNKAPAPLTVIGDINMEVPITADEVIRAGGFGATDGISSILPVASDSTDFEDRLRDVRGYEESEDKISEEQSDPPKEAGKVDVKDINNVESQDALGVVNVEASVTSDEMIRAGGFGATDDISSLLPVASDFTDFEANLRDARDYEGSEEKINRPGLGWTNEAM